MIRLDILCVDKGIAESRTKSKKLILDGRVFIDGKAVTKPSELVDESTKIEVNYPENDYVSRGALKLLGAIEAFGINAQGRICLDIGASTGGFTQVLLENGASLVYAVDVGKGQLHPKIKSDKRVVSMEETNARELSAESFPLPVSLIVMDVSFISQALIYPAISKILSEDGIFISLIKPQFEVGRENIGKGGIVKNEKLYIKVIEKLKSEAEKHGLVLLNHIPSPIEGGDGNKEFLAYFSRNGE